MAGTQYQEFLQAVGAYYGEGSDQWVEIAKYGTSADNFESIVNQLPNYRVVKSQSGNVLGYERFGNWNTSNPASQINSNLQVGARQSVKSYTPATTGIDSQTGKVTATKNVSTTSGAQFVTKTVVPAIAAAGVGISLGKTIDSTLYNLNPDFWDARGMSALNPQTWADITTGMDGNVGETLLGNAFNMLFGINPNNGQMTGYIDQNAFAYLAMYMQQKGAFELGGYTIDDTSGFVYPSGQWNLPFKMYSSVTANFTNPTWWATISINDGFVGVFTASIPSQSCIMLAISTNPNATGTWQYSSGAGGTLTLNAHTTHNGITYYYTTIVLMRTLDNVVPMHNIWNDPTKNNYWDIGYTCYNGYQVGGVDGIGNQPNATYPQLNNDMDLSQILAALQSQYPSLFNNSITYPVLQPDGTTTNNIYIPVPIPTNTGSEDNKPTGGTDYYTQSNQIYDPATDTDSRIWDMIWDMLNPDNDDTVPDDSTDDGGDGSTPTPILPTGSASALWKIYNPSQAQLDAFGAWLWSSDFVDQILKLFNDPMQAIIGLHKIFVTPPTSGSGAIKVGYLTSNASANYVSGQYVTVDCGTVDVAEQFGNVFDYDPFTKIRLFLPFIGVVNLSNSDVMRGKVGVKYQVDVLTGTCLAQVEIIRDTAGGVLYTFAGNCAVQYPVSSGSYVGIVTGLLGIAGGIAGTVASGGALAPMLMGAGASVGRMHADVSHSGNIGANAGAMGCKKPYLIIERPQTKLPKNGELLEGRPQNERVTISTLTGYVKIKSADYSGIPATGDELNKIRAILEGGFYMS